MLHDLPPGHVFAGDFRVERLLATGGMGAVYVAEQLSTGRRRALKLMLPSVVQNPKTRERFEQEARVASQIQSDHVVEVVAAGVDSASELPWLAMELLEGETLAQYVARRGSLTPSETLLVFRQMCHALGAGHAAGLVHRDIKPENLFLATPRRDGIPFTLKILDFGIAKLTENARAGGDATRAVGSPMWMAPEQTTSAAVQPSTDVWALGLIAFFCLTGRVYWRAGNSEEASLQTLLREVVIDPIDPASARAAELGVAHLLPPGFDSWFSKAVVREPSERHANATAALAALTPLLDGTSTARTISVDTWRAEQTSAPALPTKSSSGTGRWGAAAALGVFGIGILGLGAVSVLGLGIWYWHASQEQPATSASATPDASAPSDPVSGAQPVTSSSKTSSSAAGTRSPQKSSDSADASTGQPKFPGVPPGWRPRNTTCVKGKDLCTVNCCRPGELLSPFPECACYFKPPATGVPPGARPRNTTCVKGTEFCTVNCCQKGEFLSPFPECACYFLPADQQPQPKL